MRPQPSARFSCKPPGADLLQRRPASLRRCSSVMAEYAACRGPVPEAAVGLRRQGSFPRQNSAGRIAETAAEQLVEMRNVGKARLQHAATRWRGRYEHIFAELWGTSRLVDEINPIK